MKRSIREDGLHFPIIINEEGILLDGHNRLKACEELGIEPRFETRDFSGDKLQERKFVIVSNLRRRHLNSFQRIELSQPLLKIERDLAKERMVKAGGRSLLPDGSTPARGEAVQRVAREIGVSARTYYRALAIIEKESDEVKRKLRAGKLEVNSAYVNLQSNERRRELIALSAKPLPRTANVFCGDYRKIWPDHIKVNSVDMVFTDPQYGTTSLGKKMRRSNPDSLMELWDDLGRFSRRVLKRGGYLLAYSGQQFGYVAETCLRKHLDFYWKITVVYGSSQSQLFRKKIRNRAKQVLVFSKGIGRDHEWVFDLLRGGGRGEKEIHEWAQPESEARYLIGKFTKPNELVVDPMCGSGSALKAALSLSRRAIGFEIDPERFRVAKGVLAEVEILSSA